MNLKDLKNILIENKSIKFFINNEEIPPHFHITEIGKENRVFLVNLK